MKRKRMIKLLMSVGCDRNCAIMIANCCNEHVSHEMVLYMLAPGDHPGEPAGMVSADG